MSSLQTLKTTLKKILYGIGILSFLGLGFYQMFIRTTDEIGYLGAGKVGRQVFIQTLDHFREPAISVESDFYDHSFLSRMIVGEPLRTTLRFDIQDATVFIASEEAAHAFLQKPHTEITSLYTDKITMQDEYEPDITSFQESLNEHNVVTIQDLLAGFGFRKFELYKSGQPVVSMDIPGVKNIYHIGGD